jgi:hypothetical protein
MQIVYGMGLKIARLLLISSLSSSLGLMIDSTLFHGNRSSRGAVSGEIATQPAQTMKAGGNAARDEMCYPYLNRGEHDGVSPQ